MSNGAIVPIATKVSNIRALLEKSKQQIALALPRHLTPDRMMRIVMTSIQRTPKLLDCSQSSLMGAVIQASQLGLEPDGVLGHAYLVPYKDTCQLIVGYKGLIDLARRSGQLSTIYARVVRSRDRFRYSYGLNQTCEHTPYLPNDEEAEEFDPGVVTHIYAVARLRDGGEQFEVMSRHEIEAVRARSKAAGSGPWVTDWEEMAKKTVLRRLCKMLPCSVEMARAVAIDERADAGLPQHLDDVIDTVAVEEVQQEASSKLDQVVAKQRAAKGITVKGASGEDLTPPPPEDGREPGWEG